MDRHKKNNNNTVHVLRYGRGLYYNIITLKKNPDIILSHKSEYASTLFQKNCQPTWFQ